MKCLIAAIQFMTRIPLPAIKLSETDFAAAMRWFPAAGLIVGAVVAGAVWTGSWIDAWTGALAGLAVWVLVTGALHLDGLGDMADAAGAAHKGRERISAVLADPHIGSFGTVAIALQMLAKLVLLHVAITQLPLWSLMAVPAVARLGPLVWTLWLSPLHAGLGARFRSGVSWSHVTLWSVPLLAMAWLAPAFLAAPALFLCFGLWLQRQIGGISGDGHGAGIEIVETGLLLSLLVAGRLI